MEGLSCWCAINKQIKQRSYVFLCVIHSFSKYAWVVPLKYKKVVTIVNASKAILENSKRTPKELWLDQGSESYNNFFKKWLDDNDIKMYSTCNEGKSVVA